MKALRVTLWMAWFLVAFGVCLVLLQHGPSRFSQGAGELLADMKGWTRAAP